MVINIDASFNVFGGAFENDAFNEKSIFRSRRAAISSRPKFNFANNGELSLSLSLSLLL